MLLFSRVLRNGVKYDGSPPGRGHEVAILCPGPLRSGADSTALSHKQSHRFLPVNHHGNLNTSVFTGLRCVSRMTISLKHVDTHHPLTRTHTPLFAQCVPNGKYSDTPGRDTGSSTTQTERLLPRLEWSNINAFQL